MQPGPVHERLLRLAPCTVLVTSAPRDAAQGARRVVSLRRPAPVEQGV
jgi:hypothetical protein